jgi:phosphatidate phosphatase APP1
MDAVDRTAAPRAPRRRRPTFGRVVVAVEQWWDDRWGRGDRTPRNFRIVPHLGHAGAAGTVVRGRVLDNAEPAAAVRGEGVGAALRRTLARFLTRELPGVPLRIRVGDAAVQLETDAEGYLDVRLDTGLPPSAGPWAEAVVELAAPYRGLQGVHRTVVPVRVPGPRVTFGVISDIDDTIVHTGAQRALAMTVRTFTGSELTRTAMPGAPELYRALARGASGDADNPVFYVSSSPWNLHGFLRSFLEHRDFPLGPLLLRDLLGSGADRTHATGKLAGIAEILSTHPDLHVVLLGDSGQHDPEIYAEAVRRYPGRILAVYIREVRLDPLDGRVETVQAGWDDTVPFVLAADSAAIARHAAELGLIGPDAVRTVTEASAAEQPGTSLRMPRSRL